MAIPNKGLNLLRQEKMEDDHDIGGFDGEVSDSETGSESELEEDEDGDVKLTEPSKNAIYNTDGLIDKLGDTSWPDNVGWIHKLSIDIDQEQQQVDMNDDLARELAFYNQALEGTRRAFGKLQSMGLPFLRPADYYAEMVKTDSHMEKVKGRLLVEKRRVEEADERKKAREAKKLAKEIQAQKTKERNKQKKEEIESVKKWRKQRQQSGFAKDDKDGEMDFSFEDGIAFERSNKRRPGVAPGDWSGGKTSGHGGTGKGKKNQKKREFRNSKFGFGGKKALRKLNTAETTNDMRSFNKVNISGNKKRKR